MKKIVVILCILALAKLTGCATLQLDDTGITDTQIRNLQKLCKVWGFVKYNHYTFISGNSDWDDDLLYLLPIVYASNEDDVNYILYNWVVGLGNTHADLNWNSVMAHVDMLATLDIRISPDFTWIADVDYLGESLSAALLELKNVSILTDRSAAPVYFDEHGRSRFSNQKRHEDMHFNNDWYRLLGLFRLWNAIRYYFPHTDIMDRDLCTLLLEYIPKMLKGDCQHSYELTLASFAAHLHDAHVLFTSPILSNEFGWYVAPVRIARVEGAFVVEEILSELFPTQLEPGDVLLSLDGVDIEDRLAALKRYASIPSDEKIIRILGRYILRTHTSSMNVGVLREYDLLNLHVEAFNIDILDNGGHFPHRPNRAYRSFERLENNIGIINPPFLAFNAIHGMMRGLADTYGLIIDLRQAPAQFIVGMAEYLLYEEQPAFIAASPIPFVPGMFADRVIYSGGAQSHSSFLYEQPVVILMDELTMSHMETAVMWLRNGKNVTVMGSNSIGANGDVTILPLPGGFDIMFTGLGIFTPDGGQTQRIGLSPDIYIERTIAGIRNGWDESKEAAIRFIENSLSLDEY